MKTGKLMGITPGSINTESIGFQKCDDGWRIETIGISKSVSMRRHNAPAVRGTPAKRAPTASGTIG